MAKTKSKDPDQELREYTAKLKHPLLSLINEIRKIVLSSHPNVAEQVKWNSPAFYFTGEMKEFDPKEYKRDILVLNLHKKDQVLLVFPSGARINFPKPLLEGNYTDGRRLITIKDAAQLKKIGPDLKAIIKAWIAGVD